MKRVHDLKYDAETGGFEIDGVAIRDFRIFHGHTHIFRIDGENLPSGQRVWIGERSTTESDLTLIADGGRVQRLTTTSEVLGIEPHVWDPTIQDFNDAPLDDLLDTDIPPARNEKGERYPLVSVDGAPSREGVDHDFDLDIVDSRTGDVSPVRLSFSSASVPPKGSSIRLKFDSPPGVTGNGALSGESIEFNVPHGADRRYWFKLTSDSASASSVVAVAEPTNQVAVSVRERTPRALVAENEGIEKLLTDFFDHACSEGGAFDALVNLSRYRDVDETLDAFLSSHEFERLDAIPSDSRADRRLLAKRISDFYDAKGTAPSFEFIVRILTARDSRVVFPGDRMLRPSDSEWIQDTTIKVLALRHAIQEIPTVRQRLVSHFGGTLDDEDFGEADTLKALEGCSVAGVTTGSRAIVEEIEIADDGVVTMTCSSVAGEFAPLEIVEVDEGLSDDLRAGRPKLQFASLAVTQIVGVDVSDNIKLGSRIEFDDFHGADGTVVSKSGRKTVFLGNTGWGTTLETVARVGTTELSAKASTSKVTRGKWRDRRGHSSDDWFRLQDGYRFQTYSYEIVSEAAGEDYRENLRDAVHPAGFQMFQAVDHPPVVVGPGGHVDGEISATSTRIHVSEGGWRPLAAASVDSVPVRYEDWERHVYETDSGLPVTEKIGDGGIVSDDPRQQNEVWANQSLGSDYKNPVVVYQANSATRDLSARLSDVSSGSFDWTPGQEWPELDGQTPTESLVWAVVERGTWIVAGRRIVAGKTPVSEGITRVPFNENFRVAPIVVASVGTYEDPGEFIGRIVSSDSVGFSYSVVGDQAAHSEETLHWIAVDAGPYTPETWVAEKTDGDKRVDTGWTRADKLIALASGHDARIDEIDGRGFSVISNDPAGVIGLSAPILRTRSNEDRVRTRAEAELLSRPSSNRTMRIAFGTGTASSYNESESYIDPTSVSGEIPDSYFDSIGDPETVLSTPVLDLGPFRSHEIYQNAINDGPLWVIQSLENQAFGNARARSNGGHVRIVKYNRGPDSERTCSSETVLWNDSVSEDKSGSVVGVVVEDQFVWAAVSFLTDQDSNDWDPTTTTKRATVRFKTPAYDSGDWYSHGPDTDGPGFDFVDG